MEGEVLEDLGQVVFALGVPVQRLELGLQEVGGEGMAADSLEQGLDVRSPVLPVIAHPGHTCLEDFGLAAHVELIAADEVAQLALGQVEELLLGRHLRTGVGMKTFKVLIADQLVIEKESKQMYTQVSMKICQLKYQLC